MLKGPIARATIRTSFVLGLRLVVQAGTLLLVARMLGPEQFGAFAGVAALAVLLGTLASIGSNLVLLGAMSKDTAQRDQILSWAIPATLVCGAVLLVVFIVISKTILSAANLSLMVLLAIGSAEIWLQPLFTLVATEHHAQGRIARSQLLQVIPLALRTLSALTIIFISPNNPLDIYAIGYFLASLVALVAVTNLLNKPWPTINKWRAPTLCELKNTSGFAITGITRAAPGELDKVIAARLLPLELVGVYTAAARTIAALTLPVTAMMLSVLPRLFRNTANNSFKIHSLTYLSAFTYSVILAAALWFASPIFSTIFGDKYLGIDIAIRWLCFAIPGIALRVVSSNLLISLNKPWLRILIEILAVIVLTTSSLVLIPKLAIIGMFIALTATEWFMAIAGLLAISISVNKKL